MSRPMTWGDVVDIVRSFETEHGHPATCFFSLRSGSRKLSKALEAEPEMVTTYRLFARRWPWYRRLLWHLVPPSHRWRFSIAWFLRHHESELAQ